jgi:ParB-like chromosome segregation protein Spo0J
MATVTGTQDEGTRVWARVEAVPAEPHTVAVQVLDDAPAEAETREREDEHERPVDPADWRYGVSIHEAGHAVVAHLLGCDLQTVTITPGEGYEGMCRHHGVPPQPIRLLAKVRGQDRWHGRTNEELHTLAETRRAFAEALISLAGDVAVRNVAMLEDIWAEVALRSGAGTDYTNAEEVAASVTSSIEERDRFLGRVHARLERHFPLMEWTAARTAVEYLASDLRQRQTIPGEEAHRIIRQALRAPTRRVLADYQVMPPLAEEEYEALKASIAEHGVLVPIEYDESGNILDGHHRVRACSELGITEWPRVVRGGLREAQKRAHARQLNLARRHLSQEQRRDLIAEQLKETPEQSNRRLAAVLGVSHVTVGAVRSTLEAGGQIDHVEQHEGADGKEYPARRPVSVIATTQREQDRATRLIAQVAKAEPDVIAAVEERTAWTPRDLAREVRPPTAATSATPTPASAGTGERGGRLGEGAELGAHLVATAGRNGHRGGPGGGRADRRACLWATGAGVAQCARYRS